MVSVIMHHYRSREDETSCGGGTGGGGGGDPYFYLRLSAGSVPYNPIKLEVDVKSEPSISPIVSSLQQQHHLQQQQQQQHQQHQLQHQQDSPPDQVQAMDTVAAAAVCVKGEELQGTTGIGLLALTQLEGYGGYKPYCDGTEAVVSSTVDCLQDRIDPLQNKVDKYSYGRLMYSSPDDIKHQVHRKLFCFARYIF